MTAHRIRRVLFVLSICALSSLAFARVDRVEILSRADVLGGKPFGTTGPYEKIVGRVYFKVRPDALSNRGIVDLDKAPRNVQGEVEFSADMYLLRPKNAASGNGAMLLEIPNRGGKGLLRLINGAKTGSGDPTSESDFGDGWLMRQGYVVGWLGWQWDVVDEPGQMRLYAPAAHGPNGQSLKGLLRDDFTLAQKRFDMPLGHLITGRIGGTEYPVSNPSDAHNVLTVRDSPTAARQVIPRSKWSFAHEVDGKIVPSDRYIHLNSGFVPGKIYELVYAVKDPVVAGLGLAAVRDFVSYAKYDKQSVAPVQHAYALGISQTGRFLRHFLYQGFNADEQNRKVLDGVLSHVAGAGRGSFNHRFAQPSRDAQPMSSIFYPTDIFPFTDLDETDPLSRQTGGLLHATAAKVEPKIFYSNTSYEYWGRAASLIHTVPVAKNAGGKMLCTTIGCVEDATIPGNVRIYLLAGLEHFSWAFPPELGRGDLDGQQLPNANPVRWLWRAMIANMDTWVRDGIEPPPSNYPRVSDGTLVPLEKLAFPRICQPFSTGDKPKCISAPANLNLAYRLDFGPNWARGIISNQPPLVGKSFPVLVPRVDADGNDVAGVHIPEMSLPLATYTGWNLRDPRIGAPDQRVSFIGSYIPFLSSPELRKQYGDPRPSIAERYKSKEEYLKRYQAAADDMVQQRWLLKEDVDAVVERGEQEWDAVSGWAQTSRH